jgi:mannose-6-phosphate isomerase-like protein (cupin superfamily)
MITIKKITFAVAPLLLVATTMGAADTHVDIYSAKDIDAMFRALSKGDKSFASRDLPRYSNHYLMLAQRETTGSSEVHEHEADIFFIEGGTATIITGGKVVEPKTTKPGEIRGSSITGGERHSLATGDIIHIPAGVPHQLIVDKAPFNYFVIKVTGQ